MSIQVEGKTFNPRIRTSAGVPATIKFGADANDWTLSLAVEPKTGNRVMVRSDIQHGQQKVGQPSLLLPLGETGGIHMDADEKHPDIDLKLTLIEWPAAK